MAPGTDTADEPFEAPTRARLGLHARPVPRLDPSGYFGPLLAQVARAVQEGVVRPDGAGLPGVEHGPEALLQRPRRLPPRPPVALDWAGLALT